MTNAIPSPQPEGRPREVLVRVPEKEELPVLEWGDSPRLGDGRLREERWQDGLTRRLRQKCGNTGGWR